MPTRVDYFANAVILASSATVLLGINAILRPASALSLLKFPAPRQPEGQKLAYSLMQIYGARNVAIGLTSLFIWASGDRRALGLAMFAGLPMAIVDGFVSKAQIGSGEWGHWGFAPVAIALGAGLLGWL